MGDWKMKMEMISIRVRKHEVYGDMIIGSWLCWNEIEIQRDAVCVVWLDTAVWLGLVMGLDLGVKSAVLLESIKDLT